MIVNKLANRKSKSIRYGNPVPSYCGDTVEGLTTKTYYLTEIMKSVLRK